jgi:hypothetical protein
MLTRTDRQPYAPCPRLCWCAVSLPDLTDEAFLILYRRIAGGIYIARVVHTKRDIANMLLLEELL